jgi:hypothetical protein
MQYLLLYLIVGLPFAIVVGLAHRGDEDVPPEHRVLFGLFMLPFWPLFTVAVVREMLLLRRLRVICSWCNDFVAPYGKPGYTELWAEHVLKCPKHPARARIAELEAQLSSLEARAEEVMAENERLESENAALMARLEGANHDTAVSR